MSAAVHELTAVEAHAICAVLHAVEHIPVDASVTTIYGRPVVWVWAVGRELSTKEEVSALCAFAAVSVTPVRWYPVVD